jgi:hypothetical protein
MNIRVELTDTFGGEANYAWVRRAALPLRTDSRRAAVRAAKAWAGWTGLRCDVDDYGDALTIAPAGICQVIFVNFEDTQ